LVHDTTTSYWSTWTSVYHIEKSIILINVSFKLKSMSRFAMNCKFKVQWNFPKPASTGTREIGQFIGVAGFVRLLLQSIVKQGLKNLADIQGFWGSGLQKFHREVSLVFSGVQNSSSLTSRTNYMQFWIRKMNTVFFIFYYRMTCYYQLCMLPLVLSMWTWTFLHWTCINFPL
jgi:hypothetical protein